MPLLFLVEVLGKLHHLAEDLLREEHHRVTLAATLRVPEDAHATVLRRLQRLDRAVHAEELMIPRHQLADRSLALREAGEILHQIQQPTLLTSPPQQGVQRNVRRLFLLRHLLPIPEALPLRRQAADLALHPVRDQQEAIVVEKLRDRLLVVGQVLVKSLPHVHPRLLQLDQDQRQTVHKADQIRPPRVEIARDPELRDQ